MLFSQGVDLTQQLLLLIGNGPSSWWMGPSEIERLRETYGDSLTVLACNRTASRVGADVACAVDRTMIREFLDLGVYHSSELLVGFEVFASILKEDGIDPPGLVDGKNLFFFANEFQGTGTGNATFQTVARMKSDAIYLIGFDGGADPRTRWTGTDGYRKTATHPGILDQWNGEIVRAARQALDDGTVHAIGAAPTPGGALLAAIGSDPRCMSPPRRKRAAKFLLQMDRLCEERSCQPSR